MLLTWVEKCPTLAGPVREGVCFFEPFPGPDTMNLGCSPQHDAPQPDRSIAKMISEVRSLANANICPKELEMA
jgi:hypothetical protein